MLFIGLIYGTYWSVQDKAGNLRWILVLGLAFGCLLSVIQLISPRIFALHLDEKGMTVRWLFRKSFYSWDQIESFQVRYNYGKYSRMRRVYFNLKTSENPSIFRRINRRFGGDVGLPDSYGRDPNELAALLEDWRRRCSRASSIYRG